eukprot:2075709-Rhodomonas_salina.2
MAAESFVEEVDAGMAPLTMPMEVPLDHSTIHADDADVNVDAESLELAVAVSPPSFPFHAPQE